MKALFLGLVFFSSFCQAEVIPFWEVESEGGSGPTGTLPPPPTPGTPCSHNQINDEAPKVDKILAEIYRHLDEKWDKLGEGFYGNLTGGPKCTEVNDEMQRLWDKMAKEEGIVCYDLKTVFDSGNLPFDLRAHVACALVTVDMPDKPICILDPWRTGGESVEYIDPAKCSFGDKL